MWLITDLEFGFLVILLCIRKVREKLLNTIKLSCIHRAGAQTEQKAVQYFKFNAQLSQALGAHCPGLELVDYSYPQTRLKLNIEHLHIPDNAKDTVIGKDIFDHWVHEQSWCLLNADKQPALGHTPCCRSQSVTAWKSL